MNDSLGVRRFQSVCDLNGYRQQLLDFHRLPGHLLRERLAHQQLHHDEMPALVLLDRVDGADIGMVQGRSRARLALKALEQLAVLGHFGRKKFQRHAAAKLRILGFVHHAHSACADLLDNLVMRKSLSDQGSGLWHEVHILVCR